jgi:hypothetical protein
MMCQMCQMRQVVVVVRRLVMLKEVACKQQESGVTSGCMTR